MTLISPRGRERLRKNSHFDWKAEVVDPALYRMKLWGALVWFNEGLVAFLGDSHETPMSGAGKGHGACRKRAHLGGFCSRKSPAYMFPCSLGVSLESE